MYRRKCVWEKNKFVDFVKARVPYNTSLYHPRNACPVFCMSLIQILLWQARNYLHYHALKMVYLRITAVA